MTLAEWINHHYRQVLEERETLKGASLRLGQRFFNEFLKNEDDIEGTILFYETDDNKAIWMIEKWLQDKHYFDKLPEKVKR